MTTIDVYSRAGVDKRFALRATQTDILARVIRLEAAGPGGVAPNLDNMLPHPADPAGPAAHTIGFIGDSWCTAGAGAGPGSAPEGMIMPMVAAEALGAGAAISGQGSTGWARVPDPNPTGAAVFSDSARIDKVLDAHPSLLVVVGSVNDNWAIDKDPTGAPAAIEASVKALVERVRNRAPAMPILIVGPQPTSEYRAYAGASHKNAKAVRAGVNASGGADNGVHFVDWLGVATNPANKWDPATSPARHWRQGEIICYDGVNYEVTADTWDPQNNPDAADPYLASYAPSAPVSRRSAVLSGTGAVGKPPASGTRALWLMQDETHVNVGGARAFGLELAARILRGVGALREWLIAKGPAIVGPAPPPALIGPAGAAADVRSTRWGVKWGALSVDSLNTVLGAAPAAPFSVALPVRASKDTAPDRFVVSTPNRIILKDGGNGPQINQSTIAQLKAVEDVNGVVATLGEALALLNAAPARTPIVVECQDTVLDTPAQYWESYDKSMMRFLMSTVGADAAKRIVVVTDTGLNAARAKAKADPDLSKLTRLVVRTSGKWLNGEIAALGDVNAVALRPADIPASGSALAAIKAHPDKPALWWAGMTTAQEVRDARAASSAAGMSISGWLAEATAAATEIALKAQPEQP